MEEFAVSPPNALLYLLAGIVGIGLLSLLVKRGERRKKLSAVAILVVISVVLGVWLYRPITITVDEQGISTSGRLAFEFAWEEVDSALFEPNLPTSEWRPTVRRLGAAIGSYRTGRFLLSNGESAQVVMEREDATVIVRANESTYLLAPGDVEKLAEAIDQYRTIGGSPND